MNHVQVCEIGEISGRKVERRTVGKKCGFPQCKTVLNSYNLNRYCFVHSGENMKKYDNDAREKKYKAYISKEIESRNEKDYMNFEILARIINNNNRVKEVYLVIESWDEKKSIVDNAKQVKKHPDYARYVANRYGLKYAKNSRKRAK